MTGSLMTDWRMALSPTLEDLEGLAGEAFARLPEHFRARCTGVVIRVEDFPEEDVLDELDAETPYDILGLYQGVSLEGRENAVAAAPDMIFLYRRPILDYWAEYEESLGFLITHVLVHEIGHHFGLSDADMEGIEASVEADPAAGALPNG